MLTHCSQSNLDDAYKIMLQLWKMGYSAEDIITNVFRVCKTIELAEYIKLAFIKEIGYTHMKIVQGTNSLLQMAALLAKLCEITNQEWLLNVLTFIATKNNILDFRCYYIGGNFPIFSIFKCTL